MVKRKNSRMGGKFTGSHTTVVPAASEIADIADRCAVVTKISLGFIKAGLPPAKGKRRLKMQIDDGSILITVRDNISQQELRVYATEVGEAKRVIASGATKLGFRVTG